jgi:hypothetical protein
MIQVEPESVLQVHLVCILDRKIKQLWNRAIELVRVQWTWYGPEDMTWEHEDAIRGNTRIFLKILEILLMLCESCTEDSAKIREGGL